MTIVGIVAFAPLVLAWDWLIDYLLNDRIVARVRPPDGHMRQLLEEHLGQIELVSPRLEYEGWGIVVAHRSGKFVVTGGDAKLVASQLLARLNCRGASRRQLAAAVDLIANAGGPENFISWAIAQHESRRATGDVFHDPDLGALGLTDAERLALEMAVNEDMERCAGRGELEAVRRAWRDAEEVAGIADDLLIPDWIRRALQRTRGPTQ
jgi:hypothetical protein